MNKTEQKPEMTKEEFAEKWVGINNGEKHCSAPTDCYYRISDTNICTDPGEGHERCKWNKEPSDLFLSDLRSVIRGELIREADELKKQNPYPESVFIPIEAETLRKVIKYLKQGGYSPDALFGHWGRTVWNNCVERLKENNNQ